ELERRLGPHPVRLPHRRRAGPVLRARRLPGRLQLLPPPPLPPRAHRPGGARHAQCALCPGPGPRLAYAAGSGGGAGLHYRRPLHAARLLPERLATRLPATLRRPRRRPAARGPLHPERRSPVKIGLLAMSGIRAHDAELLALGLTLPGFVERSKAIATLPSLGLLDLAAVTPPGHDLRYFESEADGAEPAEIYDCDLVAVSTFSAQVREAYAIAGRLREAGLQGARGRRSAPGRPAQGAGHAQHGPGS